MKAAKASRNFLFFWCASAMCSRSDCARSGIRLLNSSMARWNSRSSDSSWEKKRFSNAAIFDRFAQREFAGLAAVLIEHGGLGVLEDGVAGRVSGLDLLLDFGGEFVGGILRLPPAAGQTELVADGAVGDHALAARVSGELRHQRPAALFGGLVEQVLERACRPSSWVTAGSSGAGGRPHRP